MEMILRQDTGQVIELRPDGWQWGRKEIDGSIFAVIHVTEEWMEMDWLIARVAFDSVDADGNRLYAVKGNKVFHNGVDTGLAIQYTTMYGTVPSAD